MKNKGFTLIEIILALAIIGIISIPVFTTFNSALSNVVKAGNRTQAIEEAKYKLEMEPDETPIPGGINVSIEMESDSPKVVSVNVNEVVGEYTINQGTKRELKVEILSYIPY